MGSFFLKCIALTNLVLYVPFSYGAETIQNACEDRFEANILESDQPVLVYFQASWCCPCKKMTPILEETTHELKDRIKIIKINSTKNKELMSKYKIHGTPTMILFKDGIETKRHQGTLSKDELKKWLQDLFTP